MKLKSAVVTLLILVAVGNVGGLAQEPIPTTKDYTVWAHEFLRAVYPELSGKKYVMTLETSGGYDYPGVPLQPRLLYVGEGTEFLITGTLGGYVATGPPTGHPTPLPPGVQLGPQHPKQVLKASFLFDNYDHLVNFGATGTARFPPESIGPVYEYLHSHPEMTEDEVAAALKKGGVKYGPNDKEQLIKDLPIASLERFLGKIKIVSVKPLPPFEENQDNAPAWGYWAVIAEVKRRDGTVDKYEIDFDPFNGKLTGLWIPSRGIPVGFR